MKLGIVTDSTSDLPENLIQEHNLRVVPSVLAIDGSQYSDGVGLSRQEFYERLPRMSTAPTTAAPSIGEFTARYRDLLEEGCEHILSIHASARLTAITAAAAQAAAAFPGRVSVVDSGSLSLGLGFQVLAAAEASEGGLQAVLQAIESTRRRLRLHAALDTLEYARRSGRISTAAGLFGSLLHVKPIIELRDGELKAAAAARTTRQADDRLAGMLGSDGPLLRLAILHTAAESRAREFVRRILLERGRILPRDILLINVSPVIGAHVGPNGLGFAAVRA